jgi:hypothetical protein
MITTLLVLFLGRLVGHNLLQWWIACTSPPLVDTNNNTWPETDDNWHENSIDDMEWEPTPLNDWEAASLPEPWWNELPPHSSALPPKERRRAEYRQIENLTP